MRNTANLILIRAAAAAAVWLCGATASLCQTPVGGEQRKPAEQFEVPFDQWISAGETQQIPWQVHVDEARLGMDQRLHVTFRIVVDAKWLNRRSETHNLHLVARVRTPEGPWFASHVSLQQELSQALPNNTEIEFAMQFYAVPGKYVLGMVLYDSVTRERSVQQRPMTVAAVKNDPLPAAFQGMPAVEFLGEAVSEQISFSYTESGRLSLPVRPKRPVRLELLMNLDRAETPPAMLYESPWIRRMRRSRRQPEARSAALLSTLKALADLRVQNGSMHLTALDLTRRAVAFQQDDIQQVDWRGLTEAVKKNNQPMISAEALGRREQNAAFFREVVERRLTNGPPDDSGAAAGKQPDAGAAGAAQPIRVLIIVSEALLFSPGTDLRPLAVRGCDCRVFHVRHLRSAVGGLDDLDRILKPVKPQRFEVITPMDLRRALRKIIDEIEKL